MTFLDKMLDFIQPWGLSHGSQAGEKKAIQDYVPDMQKFKILPSADVNDNNSPKRQNQTPLL